MSKTNKAGIVFAHGLWADGSCFSKLIPALQADGHEVIAAQYGLNTVTEEVRRWALVTKVFRRNGRRWPSGCRASTCWNRVRSPGNLARGSSKPRTPRRAPK